MLHTGTIHTDTGRMGTGHMATSHMATGHIGVAPTRTTNGFQLQVAYSELREFVQNLTHPGKLWLYMVIVFGHFSEHAMQLYQIYIMGWLPKDSGGLLGLWFPSLAQAEVLHFFYNGFQIAGIVLLLYGFHGGARKWWTGALVAQSWHMFEHVLLQLQWLTGIYLFGASQQMGIGQLLLPRAELHFFYNLSVFIPTMAATVLYFNQLAKQK